MDERAPSVVSKHADGQEFVVLREPATGSEAWILPRVGANCVKFETRVDGEPLAVIGLPADWSAFHNRPTLFGAAVLAPFPGRVRGGRFRFLGAEYQLPINEPDAGNALHGWVSRRPWTVLETNADDQGARATLQISSDDQPDRAEIFPFSLRLTVTIVLSGGRLRHSFVAENPGDAPMPFGLGLHPYVPLPLGGQGSVDDHEMWLDAPYYWEQTAFMPVGAARRAADSIDLRVPRSLRALASVGIGGPDRLLNFVHSQFSHDQAPDPSPSGVRCGVRNPATRREVVVEGDTSFPAAVTYIPVTRDKISFEPHTCLPNAFNLQAEGVRAGTIVLGPGGFWRGNTAMSARAF